MIVDAVDALGVGVTGLTVSLSIRREIDGRYWNGTAFQTIKTTVTMIETDSSNEPGRYHYDFRPLMSCSVYYHANTGSASVKNKPWQEQAIFGDWPDALDSNVSNATSSDDLEGLGLNQLEEEVRRLRISFNTLERAVTQSLRR